MIKLKFIDLINSSNKVNIHKLVHSKSNSTSNSTSKVSTKELEDKVNKLQSTNEKLVDFIQNISSSDVNSFAKLREASQSFLDSISSDVK